MKARLCVFILSLTLLLSALGAVAQGTTPSLPARHWETGEAVVSQDRSRNVQLVGQIGGDTNAVAVRDHYAYIGIGPRLVILDVSNPALPTVVGKTDVLPGNAEGVALAGDYAYVAAGGDGLRIIDVSDPGAPSEAGFYNTLGYAHSVALAEGWGAGRIVPRAWSPHPRDQGFIS